uniref:CCDC66 domain-containing protein n=1 Tax=Trichogramma kaykai TaxID=54128 RepID=A0ABD2W957_9HYME
MYRFRLDTEDKNLADDDERKWKLVVPREQRTMRNRARQACCELIYGRQPEQPGSFRREVELEAQDQEQEEAVQAWKNHLNKLPEKHETAAENMKKANEKQAKYYNANQRKTDFDIGEKVWKTHKVLSNASKAISSKLTLDFAGPFTITKKLRQNTFEIVHDKSNKIFSPVHASQIKKFNSEEEEEPRKTESQKGTSEVILSPDASENLIITEPPRANVTNAKKLEPKQVPKRKVTAHVEPMQWRAERDEKRRRQDEMAERKKAELKIKLKRMEEIRKERDEREAELARLQKEAQDAQEILNTDVLGSMRACFHCNCRKISEVPTGKRVT